MREDILAATKNTGIYELVEESDYLEASNTYLSLKVQCIVVYTESRFCLVLSSGQSCFGICIFCHVIHALCIQFHPADSKNQECIRYTVKTQIRQSIFCSSSLRVGCSCW